MNGRRTPWWLWLLMGLLVLAAMVLGVIYFQKTRSSGTALTPTEVDVPGAKPPSSVDWGIRKMQETGGFRTVKIVGIIEKVAAEGDHTYMQLKNLNEVSSRGLTINLGRDESVLGVFFPDDDASSSKRTWNNAKLIEIKDKLLVGLRAEVEVITWFNPELDCGERTVCIDRVDMYQNHKEDNAVLDEMLFVNSDAAVIERFSGQFSELTFGPASTLMVVK